MYPDIMAVPMREELTRIGIREARTAEEVDKAIRESKGTLMVVVNSVCGCSAGKMRPAVRLALQTAAIKPDRALTVFAGQDKEATARAREYFGQHPPSSPSIAILREGKPVYFMARSDIEGRDAATIAGALKQAFEKFCRASSELVS